MEKIKVLRTTDAIGFEQLRCTCGYFQTDNRMNIPYADFERKMVNHLARDHKIVYGTAWYLVLEPEAPQHA